MFKSEILILIFLVVILAILYFNTTKEEFKTTEQTYKKITIENEENYALIITNLQTIIDTITGYIVLDNNVNELQLKIDKLLALKLEKQTENDNEIQSKNSLEVEESKIKNEQSINSSDIILNGSTIRNLNDEIDLLNNKLKKVKPNNNINIITKNINDLDNNIKNINNTLPLEDRFKYLLDIESTNIYIKELKELKKELEELDKELIKEQALKTKTDNDIKKMSETITVKKKTVNDLDNKNRKIQQNVTINESRLNQINTSLITHKINIKRLIKEIEKLTNNILELENEKNQKIRERTNEFNTLNDQLISYELEELLEDVNKLKKTKEYYEQMLKNFKETRKIEFGELKVKDNDYRKHNLLRELKDDDKQKNMYYKITNTELKNKLDELCAKKESTKYGNYMIEENLNEYCKNEDYEKICHYDILNNVITDNNNDNNNLGKECMKIKPFINKIPYTITKK